MKNKDEAKYQHYIPRVYLRAWCFSNNSVWYYDKHKMKNEQRNINNIFGQKHYYSIKAGSIHTNKKALKEIFGILDDYKVIYQGNELITYEDYNCEFDDFSEWELYNNENIKINKKEKNKIYQNIKSINYNEIEDNWNIKYENNWPTFSEMLHQKLILSIKSKKCAVDKNDLEMLMEYSLMFENRSKEGNPFVKKLLKSVNSELNMDKTLAEQFNHNFMLHSYEKQFNKKGALYDMTKQYTQELTYHFLLANDKVFFTSDRPCINISRTKNTEPHYFFVISPYLLVEFLKKDSKNSNAFLITKAKEVNIKNYNKLIVQYSDYIISNKKIENIDFYL